ncbi:hypothetical protein [Streptomyces sp. NPDC059788]|uniref:hypothetical protein n=1 Tax=Streptomyces sp. NPDC059788 TaxID=3346948 RepID=UPI003650E122
MPVAVFVVVLALGVVLVHGPQAAGPLGVVLAPALLAARCPLLRHRVIRFE